MEYFRVVNLEKYQHYKDRNPPWIKLHQTVLDDYEFACLRDAIKLHLLLIWLLASRSDNKLPYDKLFIQRRINATEPVDLDALLSAGFIEKVNKINKVQNAIMALADCAKDARPETEAEREKNIDQFDIFWEAYPKKVGKGQAVKSYKSALKKTDHDTIMLGLKEYLNFIKGKDPAFIAHPSTWLNGERWGDELEQKKMGAKF